MDSVLCLSAQCSLLGIGADEVWTLESPSLAEDGMQISLQGGQT